MIKMITLVKRHPSLTREEFNEHWANVHAPLARNTPGIKKCIHRYVQNYVSDGSDVASQQFGGLGLPDAPFDFDGIVETWFNSMDDLKELTSGEVYFNVLKPDEDQLTDKTKSVVYLVDERTIIDKDA